MGRIVWIFILVLLSLVIFWCKKVEKSLTRENKNAINNMKDDEKKRKDKDNVELTEFESTIIQIAVKQWTGYCRYIENKNKQKYCIKLVEQENQYLKDLECEKLIYLKDECYDKKYLKFLDCWKIRDIIIKRRCEFEKKYQEAIKNHDESFCKRLPRIKQKECYRLVK